MALTPDEGPRHAAPTVDARRERVVVVTEDHAGPGEPDNRLTSVHARGGGPAWTLAEGRDFYASPRLAPDGSKLAWIEWDHPGMPWDGTDLVVADLDDAGRVRSKRHVAGGPDESIFQPEWGPRGELFFVSDRSGFWNPHVLADGAVRPILSMAAEFGLPQWVFEMSTYAVLADGRLACAFTDGGRWHLGLVDVPTGALRRLDTPYTDISDVRTNGREIYFCGASATRGPALVALEPTTGATRELRRISDVAIDPAYLSEPEVITFPTTGAATAHGLYYPPKSPDHRTPSGERPPLIVKSHGGPTAAASTTLNLKTQFWTSRGIAVLDVDYRGSTGYGRAYRKALDGAWGIADVDDCVAGAQYLATRGDVDPERLIITGGSAGGYTTLASLAFRDVFRAGASYYGISDLETLARDTHKFESRYLDSLVGPYPEARDVYRDRSPIRHPEGLSCSVIFFQGLDDEVVPPSQAGAMVRVLRGKGIPVAYVPFSGEAHGFRKAESIVRSLEAELSFYSQIFGFSIDESIEPVTIEGL
jgi:dipeptidyl aminopeptidase/acylaminoacyl peptidase